MTPIISKHPIYTGWLCGYRTNLFTVRNDEDAGRGRFAKGADLYGRIEVGIDASWQEVCGTLLHEVAELCMDHLGCSYNAPRSSMRPSCSNRFFAFNHNHLDEVTAAAGDYLAFAMPELFQAWKKAQKKQKPT